MKNNDFEAVLFRFFFFRKSVRLRSVNSSSFPIGSVFCFRHDISLLRAHGTYVCLRFNRGPSVGWGGDGRN